MAAFGVFCPSVGGSSTRLNRVVEGGWQLSLGLTISRPSRTSHLVMITNSAMARHTSLTSPPKDGPLGSPADSFSPPNAAGIGNRPWSEVSASAAHLDIIAFRGGRLLSLDSWELGVQNNPD